MTTWEKIGKVIIIKVIDSFDEFLLYKSYHVQLEEK